MNTFTLHRIGARDSVLFGKDGVLEEAHRKADMTTRRHGAQGNH